MDFLTFATCIAIIITAINALRFPYEFWMNLKWTGVLILVGLIVVVPVDPSHVFQTIGGELIFAALIFMVWFFVVSMFLTFADRIDDALTDMQPQQVSIPARQPHRRGVVYGELVENLPIYDSEIVDEYQQLNSRNPQTKRLLTSAKADWFEKPFEPKVVGDFCVCNNCGKAQNWIAGFVNICISCGKKL